MAGSDPKEVITIEQVKENLVRDIKSLNAAQKNIVLQAVEDVFGGKWTKVTPSRPSEKTSLWFVSGMIVIPVLALAAEFLPWPALEPSPEPQSDDSPFDLKGLLALLAFTLAVASYLASVSREIVKKLSEEQDEEKYKDQKRNIGWIVLGEIHLIMIGLLTIVRVLFGNITTRLAAFEFSLDKFLLSYLIVAITYLAVAHIRIWIINTPWRCSFTGSTRET